MSKKTRGRRPGPKKLQLVKKGDKPPVQVHVKLPPPPKPGELAPRKGVPLELYLREPIPGPDGELTDTFIQGQGADWALVSVLCPHDEKSAVLAPAYQIQMLDEDGVGWMVTVPLQNVVGARMAVYRVPVPAKSAPEPEAAP